VTVNIARTGQSGHADRASYSVFVLFVDDDEVLVSGFELDSVRSDLALDSLLSDFEPESLLSPDFELDSLLSDFSELLLEPLPVWLESVEDFLA
jgi:hypothetical protein